MFSTVTILFVNLVIINKGKVYVARIGAASSLVFHKPQYCCFLCYNNNNNRARLSMIQWPSNLFKSDVPWQRNLKITYLKKEHEGNPLVISNLPRCTFTGWRSRGWSFNSWIRYLSTWRFHESIYHRISGMDPTICV